MDVISGFQGVTSQGRITTLGRGGSDTTAVALAAALKAERCDIYTDVERVYTAYPHWVHSAQKLDANWVSRNFFSRSIAINQEICDPQKRFLFK